MATGEPDLAEAVALAERTGHDVILRRCLRWLTFAEYRLGQTAASIATAQRLLELSRIAGDREHEAWAHAGLALSAWDAGRSRPALEAYRQALGLFLACDNERGAAFARNGLGTVLQALGELDEAMRHYRQAAESARKQGWPWLEALAENNTATLLFTLGDPGQARDLFQRAADLHTAAGDAAEAALAGANIAFCETALGRFAEAEAVLERARAECRQRGIGQLDSHLGNALADILGAQGRVHQAARIHREILGARSPAPAKERMTALTGLARELARLDSLTAAIELLEPEVDWAEALEDPSLRAEFRLELGRRRLAVGRASEALPPLSSVARDTDRPGLNYLHLPALSAAARAARALAQPESALVWLQAATACWEAERGLPIDAEWREIRGAEAVEVRTQLALLLLDHAPAASAEERARIAFDAVQIFKARTLLERMRGPAGGEAPAAAISPVTCRALQRGGLRPAELLLDYHLAEDEGLVFAVTAETCRAALLPGTREIGEAIALYNQLLATPQRSVAGQAAIDEATGRMRELFLAPFADLLASHPSVIIVPDGALHRMSFAALLASRPAGNESRVVQIVPSATILAELRATIGNNATDDDPPASILALAGDVAAGGRPLSGARQEVRDLAARYRNVRTTLPRVDGGDSTATATAGEALASHGLLHLAAHATIESEHPWRSALHIGVGPAPEARVDLTAADIARTRLAARLAVLSTCRSAGGRELTGEGVQGLASAFLVAGVPAVVATLWPVDDGSTRHVVRRFYDHLAHGSTVAEALAGAQNDLRRDPALRDPYHWAGFVVIGDGHRRVPIAARPALERWALPLALIAGGAVAVLSHFLATARDSRS